MSETIDKAFDKHFGKKPENLEIFRTIDQRVTRLEQYARQPRLAMEADGPADTKTRKRTEGTATVVQAIHGDSCSANRVYPDPKTTSTSFGMNADPPSLPCRDDVLVDNGAAAPKSCLSPLEMRTTTAVGGLLPTGETSTATRTTSDFLTLWLCQPKRCVLKGLQFHPPGTTAVSREINYLLPPPAGGSFRHNPGKNGCSIQAVLKVVSTPARFGERGALCFLVRLCVLERLVTICSVVWRMEGLGFKNL